jgi:3-hydroxyisobutyrate dehydrogenase-like beta-hydroxyacid dehydrogenase
MARIAILHPGDMGAAVGRSLVDIDHEVFWLPPRSQATEHRADAARMRPAEELSGCDVVIGLCPPGAAGAVAAAAIAAGARGIYVDANAIAPRTAEQVARSVRAAGLTYVDGSVVGPPPTDAGTTRLFLSGDGAADVAAMFVGAPIEARVLDNSPYAASALKMCYAAWSKITAALVLSAREAAQRFGIEADLLTEWSASQPTLEQRHATAHASATVKGWRWTDEMDEIAVAFAEVGLPDGFGRAAAETFARYPRPA